MAHNDYIYFDTTDAVRKPVDFAPQREDVYAGEYTTCTGAIKADRIGWKYADLTLSWDALPQDDVDILLGITSGNTLTWDDIDGTTITENIIRTSVVGLKHRNTVRGTTWWRDVTMEVRFIDVH
jgi:hypothetical protein